jgi:hypothetical protein
MRFIAVTASEERRHTLHIGLSIGAHGRRVPSPIVILSVLDGGVLMTVRQHLVQFADTYRNTFSISIRMFT